MNLACLMVGCSLAMSALAQSSASFRADAQHSGLYPDAGAPVLHGYRWRYPTHGPVYGSATVADDAVFIGSNDHYLYSLALADGVERWKFKTGSRVDSTPALADGLVLFFQLRWISVPPWTNARDRSYGSTSLVVSGDSRRSICTGQCRLTSNAGSVRRVPVVADDR